MAQFWEKSKTSNHKGKAERSTRWDNERKPFSKDVNKKGIDQTEKKTNNERTSPPKPRNEDNIRNRVTESEDEHETR